MQIHNQHGPLNLTLSIQTRLLQTTCCMLRRYWRVKVTEVKYERLSDIQQELMDEAKAREVSEVVQSMALRKIQSHEEYVDAHQHPERHIPMRWVFNMGKPLYPPEKPQGGGPHVVDPSGEQKAKARVVLIGFRHPELVEKDNFTGRPLLQTSSPTISRLGRHMLLQSMAFDQAYYGMCRCQIGLPAS